MTDPFKIVRSGRENPQINRRHFVYTSALAAAALAVELPLHAAKVKYKSPNEKLDIGGIGTGGKGAVDLNGVSGENIVALCDVDSQTLAKAAQKYPGAKLYSDYRVMIEKEKSIDAVTVTVPDHHHAPAAMRAIHAGKHVYCQKPLTKTVWEARQLRLAAKKYRVATQMGNQGHAGEGVRHLCEMIWSGAIGPVREVHCWTDRAKGWWPQGRMRPAGSDPVPSHLNWDLWLGPAPKRPYLDLWPADTRSHILKMAGHVYHPFSWRGWWDFGCGALGDMGCHVMDGADWALKLNAPLSVEIISSSERFPEMPPDSCVLRYEFAARESMPPCALMWYDSGQKPPKPAELEASALEDNGSLFIGDKGKIICGVYGEKPRLLPESSMADYKRPPESIPRAPGNDPYLDWIRACKGGPAAGSNFDVSGPFSEWVLLGNLPLRTGRKIEWDSVNLMVKNDREANALLKCHYRHGWGV